jgi:putative addiction module component (TIGR02574 family)
VLDYDSLLADAIRLPVADRIKLAEALWETVPVESLPPLTDAWLEEVKRRSAEYDSGTAETIPWEQVRADALRRIGIAEPNAAD